MATAQLERRTETNGDRKVFGVVGEKGAVHFWIDSTVSGSEYGGIEMHSRCAPDYAPDKPPDNETCWLLDGPCWHDGSSLQAQEFWIPFYKSLVNISGDIEPLWSALEQEYSVRFPTSD